MIQQIRNIKLAKQGIISKADWKKQILLRLKISKIFQNAKEKM